MVDTNCEYGINSTRVYLPVMCTMVPTMATHMGRYGFDYKSDSSGDDSYRLVDRIYDDMDISNVYTDIMIQ